MAGGLEARIVFFGMAFVSRWVRDTTLQLVGWFLMLAAQVWLLVVIPTFERGEFARSLAPPKIHTLLVTAYYNMKHPK